MGRGSIVGGAKKKGGRDKTATFIGTFSTGDEGVDFSAKFKIFLTSLQNLCNFFALYERPLITVVGRRRGKFHTDRDETFRQKDKGGHI